MARGSAANRSMCRFLEPAISSMKRKTLVLQLLPNRIDVAVVRGQRVVACRHLTVALGKEAAQWIQSLRTVGESLRPLVSELGAVGWGCVVLYRSPTQIVDLASQQL